MRSPSANVASVKLLRLEDEEGPDALLECEADNRAPENLEGERKTITAPFADIRGFCSFGPVVASNRD